MSVSVGSDGPEWWFHNQATSPYADSPRASKPDVVVVPRPRPARPVPLDVSTSIEEAVAYVLQGADQPGVPRGPTFALFVAHAGVKALCALTTPQRAAFDEYHRERQEAAPVLKISGVRRRGRDYTSTLLHAAHVTMNVHCCHNCGLQRRKMATCKRCLHAHFCSTQCLRASWKSHKPLCAAIAEDRAARPKIAGRSRFCHEIFLPDALSPDRPRVCHFWLLALLSAFDPRSGSNEEGLQVAMQHLTRFVFYYTGAAVPEPLRARLAFETEVHRVRLEVLTLILSAPKALRHGPREDRVGVFCTEAANRTLRYVLQRDDIILAASGAVMRTDRHDPALLDRVRSHLAAALHLGHSVHTEHRGAVRQPEASVRGVAKVSVAAALRGSGLPSTAFGWRLCSRLCQRLLALWSDPSWWRMANLHNIVVTVDTAAVGNKDGPAALADLPEGVLRLYGRSNSYDSAPGSARSLRCVVGHDGCGQVTLLLHALDPLLADGSAGAQVLAMDLFSPELWYWYEYVHQGARAGQPWGFRRSEATFARRSGGTLRRLYEGFHGGDVMHDLWHVRRRHVLDVDARK